jgi:acyl-CoA dehydrogenase
VEEPLARIGGAAYFVEAMRRYTLSALDQGIKPPVVTAIAKYNATEMGRKCANDGMDIMGGAGISMGPRNTMAIPYIATPIGITVEGANILTRTLIIFGQGALRAHPFAYKEVDAAEKGDLVAFDKAFFGHIGHVFHNMFRSFLLSVTRGYIGSWGYGKGTGRYFQKLDWASASFAITADLAMALLGGQLKFKEKITGRFADILSWMYIGTAVLRRYQAEGYRKEDLPFVKYSMDVAFAEMQKAFEGIYQNFDVPVAGWLFKNPLRWWSNLNSFGALPADRTGHAVVSAMLENPEIRQRLAEGVYIPKDINQQVARLENAYKVIKQAEPIEKKVSKAVRKKTLPKVKGPKLLQAALEASVITKDEFEVLKKAEELRWDAIQVDDFSESEYHQNKGVKSQPKAASVQEVYGK